jgi:hypothetical protein
MRCENYERLAAQIVNQAATLRNDCRRWRVLRTINTFERITTGEKKARTPSSALPTCSPLLFSEAGGLDFQLESLHCAHPHGITNVYVSCSTGVP